MPVSAGAWRMTRQRKLMLQILSDAAAPLSAGEILAHAKQELPHLALTTVYRNLEALQGHGAIERTVYPDGAARYQVQSLHQHYLVCLYCHKQVPLDFCPMDQLGEQVHAAGFTVSGHRLEIFGCCPQCRIQGKEKNPI